MSQDEDENISTLLAMGFSDLDEVKRALRIAKNDISEAVTILTQGVPSGPMPMIMDGPGGGGSGDMSMPPPAAHQAGAGTGAGADAGPIESPSGFPIREFYELEQRVFQENWSIPYKSDEAFGRCLRAARRLSARGELETDDHGGRFVQRILPEAFNKLLTSTAIQRWDEEIQEGIYDMIDLFIDLVLERLQHAPKRGAEAKEAAEAERAVPVGLLKTLALCFDLKNDWNMRNRDRPSRGEAVLRRSRRRWSRRAAEGDGDGDGSREGEVGEEEELNVENMLIQEEFARAIPLDSYSRDKKYYWLCDLLNLFGEKGGFEGLKTVLERDQEARERRAAEAGDSKASTSASASPPAPTSADDRLTTREVSALLGCVSRCAELLQVAAVNSGLDFCVSAGFAHVEKLDETALKSNEVGAVSDLLHSLKLVCQQFRPDDVERCDKLRLEVIFRMLKAHHFSSKMNALKEVNNLIDESRKSTFYGGASASRRRYGPSAAASSASSSSGPPAISGDELAEWMVSKRVLSVALEGSIDQVQYADRIKVLVEFLGSRLSESELDKMWSMTEKANNASVTANLHGILAGAAAKFSLDQFAHLTGLIKRTWETSNGRLRERLLALIGSIGKEASSHTSHKSTQSILALLWDMAHLSSLSKSLVESALCEQLAILTEMRANKDPMRKMYVLKCVDDIKAHKGAGEAAAINLFAVKHLHNICKTYSTCSTFYSRKEEKATLAELNKQHEIVKLLCASLRRTHDISADAASPISPQQLVDGHHTHEEAVAIHLEILSFLLKEGELYLSWRRTEEMWSALVDNPNAVGHDRDVMLDWLETRIPDYEPETQERVFREMLLKMDCAQVSERGLRCFKAHFEHINQRAGNLKKVTPSKLSVESLDLIGVDFLWRVISDCGSESLASLAIDYLLDVRYFRVSPRLKVEPGALHERFLHLCLDRLEAVLAGAAADAREIADGVELEAATDDNDMDQGDDTTTSGGGGTSSRAKVKVSNVPAVPQNIKGLKLQNLNRLLLLLERYVSTIEESAGDSVSSRSQPPHATSFHGIPLAIVVLQPELSKKEDDSNGNSNGNGGGSSDPVLHTHRNELVGEVKRRIAEEIVASASSKDDLTFVCQDEEVRASKDHCRVGSLVPGAGEEVRWKVTRGAPSSTALVLYKKDDATGGTPSSKKRELQQEAENELPGVLMAATRRVFDLLYKIAEVNDNATLKSVRRLIHLIPTDPKVMETLDGIRVRPLSAQPKAAASAAGAPSPQASPFDETFSPSASSVADSQQQVEKLLNFSKGMSPFRVLYNLESLAARLLPTKTSKSYLSSEEFSRDFIFAGGLRKILDVLDHSSSMPQNLDHDLRQSAYQITLQLLEHLLCGRQYPLTLAAPPPGRRALTSPQIKPTPPKRSALDASAASATSPAHPLRSPNVLSATRFVQTMKEAEFAGILSRLMKVTWAAAAGLLHLATAEVAQQGEKQQLQQPRFLIGRRSRETSTDSSCSEASTASEAQSLHAGVCSPENRVGPGDCQIAEKALELLMTCLELRNSSLPSFYALPQMGEFVVEILLASPSPKVRATACKQLLRLMDLKQVARALNFDEEGKGSGGKPKPNTPASPLMFLAQVILRTPVPLWTPSCRSRGTHHHAVLAQSTDYFTLRCEVLRRLTPEQLSELNKDVASMLEDELSFLTNFTPCSSEDCTQMAGHIRLVEAMLQCQGVDKEVTGAALIPEMLRIFLFPASQVIAEGSKGARVGASAGAGHGHGSSHNVRPKCDNRDSRKAAYELLLELCRDCHKNLTELVTELVRMHHHFDENLLKDFSFEPAVERRAKSNFVGLKNAGATCYMNAVLQQLFCTPTLAEQVLAAPVETDDGSDPEEQVFYQLQNVFGHLLESQLKSYEPEMFWKTVRLFKSPVNVREQQDAFDFFTSIVDQMDEFLAAQKQPKLFANRFEGVFSDQMLCHGCPHRHEREQTFMGLNLEVKCPNLQESLDQFVKGELLDGDNAYFCERCGKKRDTLKRMCIKTLPKTLVIQLKRFYYDWESNRALKFDDRFEFPWKIDMAPYTSKGIRDREQAAAPASTDSPSRKKSCKLPSSSSSSAASNAAVAAPDGDPRPYHLVGVVVHSGQANAGHYYSFIKDRKNRRCSAPGGWFKFNDVAVDSFEMTDESLASECFGGSYKVKRDSSNSSSNLPEDRQRYWNAYILLYETEDDDPARDRSLPPPSPSVATPQKHKDKMSSPAAGGVQSQLRRKMSSPSASASSFLRQQQQQVASKLALSRKSEPMSAPRESLSELSSLLEKDDVRSLFSSRMSPAIERGIQEENLRFLENREVFCTDYYDFVEKLVRAAVDGKAETGSGSDGSDPLQAVRLAVHFLLNSYLHLKSRQEGRAQALVSGVKQLLVRSAEATQWLLQHLASEQGLQYLRPFLLECAFKEVRAHFADLLLAAFAALQEHAGDTETDEVNRILATLVGLVEKDIANSMKNSGQFFTVIAKFTEMGVRQCRQLFHLDAFSQLVKFLLGVDVVPDSDSDAVPADLSEQRRKWPLSQAKEFGELHRALARFVSACNLDQQREFKAPPLPDGSSSTSGFSPAPPGVLCTLYSARVSPLFVRECVSALREVSGPVAPVRDMLVRAAAGSRHFTRVLLEEIMRQYKAVGAAELKNLSRLLHDILVLEDPLQDERIAYVVDGGSDGQVDGLLHLVKECQTSDMSRSYQCIKTLVGASHKSAAVKDRLLQDADRWEWAVNWLKDKMAANSASNAGSTATDMSSWLGGGHSGGSLLGNDDMGGMSNETSATRDGKKQFQTVENAPVPKILVETFHRTTSAQATLDEADAILAEIGEEKKLEELKEKAKNNKKKRRQDEEEEEDMDVTPADGGNEEEMPDLDRQQ